MCGIFSFISKDAISNYEANFIKLIKETGYNIKYRGPDNTREMILYNKVYMIFHRLAINDLTNEGDQPMFLSNCYLICNGEIFNHKELKSKYRFLTTSKSDCEIILHLYLYLKNLKVDNLIDTLCNILDGEFSFILYDTNINTIYAARDPFGVRPLFYGYTENEDLVFSSELKGLSNLCYKAEQFTPGHSMTIYNDLSFKTSEYHMIQLYDINYSYNDILKNVNYYFKEAVYKRMMSDKEICSLLSGGLDSSLTASILSKKLGPYRLKTFAIGIKGSPDLENAKKVAKHIKSEHYSVELTEQDFLDAIPEVIYNIESYDTTTVRASVGNYLIAKYIRENTDCKVVFNGDYSDEVSGGYKYFKNAPNDEEFHKECVRLLYDIHYFDCLRSDRSISCNGLEARVPFADKDFINYYLSIPISYRTSKDKLEKLVLRDAFKEDNLLPADVLFRPKEAFSDGVTSEKRSWHKIVQEHIDTIITDEEYNLNKKKFNKNFPKIKESYFYRKIFNEYYSKFENVIPYYWMPKWCNNINDPSAREL